MVFLSVIIPAYNEAKRIGKTLTLIDAYLRQQGYTYEILVVNDGSTDNTTEVLSLIQPRVTHLRVIHNQKNNGKGYVVRQGLTEAVGEWRLFADADNATPIEEVKKFLEYADEFKVIIASRNATDSKILVGQPWYRKLLGRLYSVMAFLLAGFSGISDTQCGFKLFRHTAAKDILPHCTIYGLSFDVEMLLVAQKKGYQIKEVPVVWIDDEDSKVTFGRMVKAVFELAKIRWNTITGQYGKTNVNQFLKFCMVGFFGFLVNILFLRFFRAMGAYEFLSWILATECAVLSNYFLNNTWTFKEKSVFGVGNTLAKLFQFNLTSLGAIIMQSILGTLGVAIFGSQYDILILVLIIAFFVVPYNYFMYTKVIWKKPR